MNDNEQGAGVTVAVEEPVSPVAQLRIDLDAYDELFPTVSPYASKEAWERFTTAQDKIYTDVDEKYHMLLDVIDKQAAELARLRKALERIASKSDTGRPKKWETEQDTGYGITLGWWSAGEVAREALAVSEKDKQS